MVQTFKARKWDEEADGNGEFTIPEVPDGTYKAEIIDVTDKEFPGYEGGTQLKYMIDWKLLELEDENGKKVQLRQFLTVPDGLINSGYVHPKSNMYSFLQVMGIDPDADDFEIDPGEWLGKKATVWVKNIASKKDPKRGPRPQITDVTANQALRTGKPAARRTEEDDF